MELAQSAVVLGQRTLALQHVDLYRRLAVSRSRKRLRLLGRNRGVARNHRRGHAAQRLNRQRQRRHVEQQQVFHVSCQHPRLHRSANCHDLIRVHSLMRLFAEQLFHQRLDARHARLSAHQNHFVDLAGVNACVFQGLLARTNGALNDVIHHLLQLGARQLLHQVLRPAGVSRDKRQIDFALHGGGEFDLGFFRGVPQTLERHLIALGAKIKSFVFLELFHQPIHDALVDVVAAQVRITIGGLHLNHALADFKDRNIERAPAEVVHRDGLILLLVQPVGKRCRRGLIHNTFYVQAGNLARVFGSLALRVVKIRRNRDHGFRNRLAQIVLRRFFELLQDHGRDLRGGVFLALRDHRNVVSLTNYLVRDHLHFFVDFIKTPSHKPLD